MVVKEKHVVVTENLVMAEKLVALKEDARR